MAKVKTPQNCLLCDKEFFRWTGQVDAKYCSRRCSCTAKQTHESQSAAGRIGGAVRGDRLRGTGTSGYIKRNGRHEHRVVMEKILGRPLNRDEIVHHRDNNKHNNSPENLVVLSRADHAKHHWYGKEV